ncbi:2-phosphosulfolactate phosphatase [Bacillus marinisedimentorum]|uniref:2-phosphosulfolactate phosphatase n=1 Tax=Bacillus marinisedimentorum TaxID=1821260 RepID=UPI0007DF5329|nr:2-phosphosulfolactate phosphatase [Bacillus marinisedimentorum]
MLKLHLLLKKEEIEEEKMKENKVAVVFDVLLATSTIASALEYGAAEVIPVLDGKEAKAEAAGRTAGDFLLVGEYEGVTIEGFLSPNPLSLKDEVPGKSVILSTTNGTIAVKKSAQAGRVYAASLLNSSAVADHLAETSKDETIILVCAGSSGEFNVEDFYGAGYFIDCLLQKDNVELDLTDPALAAHLFYMGNRGNGAQVLKASRVGRMLADYGFETEIDYVAGHSSHNVVPVLEDGMRLVSKKPLKVEGE